MNSVDQKFANFSRQLILTIYGFCMGIAHIIPGVSGGTIAFIFGIYEDLIQAIQAFNIQTLKLIFKLDIRALKKQLPWRFLGCILIGTLSAIFTLSSIMKWLFEHKPVYVNAFFFGLILATVPIIARSLKKWNKGLGGSVILTSIAMYFFVGLIPINTSNAPWFLMLSGALAICTMILPGISGSFVLVLIGKYQYIITAVSERNFGVLFFVAVGCIIGILAFIRVLSWLFKKYHDPTVAVLTGLVIGSLRKIWPWKVTIQNLITSKGKVVPIEQINVLPKHVDGEVVGAFIIFIFGLLLALFLGRKSPEQIIKQ